MTTKMLEAIVGILNTNAKVSIGRDAQCIGDLRFMLIEAGCIEEVDLYDCAVCDVPAPSADPADPRNTTCYLENPTESNCDICIAKGFCDVRKGSVPSGCCRECGEELDCDEYITCPHCSGDVVRHSYFDEESCFGSDE